MKTKSAYFFLLPAILFLSVFYLLPTIQVFYYSLLNYNVFGESGFVGLHNYSKLLGDSNFWYALLNSGIFILVTPILMFISLLLALMVRETSSTTKFFRSIYFLPVVTPIVIVGIIWRYIFSEDIGLMNYLLSLFSFSQVPWLTNYPTNLISIMIVTVWRGFGYYMMIFLAGLAVIPKELEEASKIDGANRVQRVTHIIIPMLKPTLILIFVLSSTAAIKIFTELYIMIPGTPESNKTLVYFMYKQAFENFDFGYGSAVGVIIFILTMGFSYVNIKLMEKQ
jgi:putative chitobiose transport system permease protein